jgi:putative spermidine/putrescine transport system ATP-binding protein
MDFVGLSTRLRGEVQKTDGRVVQIDTANGIVRAHGAYGVGTKVTVGVRPELITPGDGENTINVTLADAMVLGAKTQLHGVSHPEDRLLCEVPGIQTTLTRRQDIAFGWSVKDTLVYEATV